MLKACIDEASAPWRRCSVRFRRSGLTTVLATVLAACLGVVINFATDAMRDWRHWAAVVALTAVAAVVAWLQDRSQEAEVIYDSDHEEPPFQSWTYYCESGIRPGMFWRTDSPEGPVLAMRATSYDVVGLCKSLNVVRGRTLFQYQVAEGSTSSGHACISHSYP